MKGKLFKPEIVCSSMIWNVAGEGSDPQNCDCSGFLVTKTPWERLAAVWYELMPQMLVNS